MLVTIDGSEGGGQMLRTSVALSLVTGKTVKITGIRRNRNVPGMRPQHVHGIKAACAIWDASVTGAEVGSTEVLFIPGKQKKRYASIDIGTAGSITLLLQTILLPAIWAGKEMRLDLIGGTDVRWSMPIDFFSHALLPYLKQLAQIHVRVNRRGYYPKGQGSVQLRICPTGQREGIDAATSGSLLAIKGIVHASADLQNDRASERMAEGARSLLKRHGMECDIRCEYGPAGSSGSGIGMFAYFRRTEDMTKGYVIGSDRLGGSNSYEKVGEEAAFDLLSQLGRSVDSHTADNLLPFIAVFGGRIRIQENTQHIETNRNVVESVLGERFDVEGDVLSMPGMRASGHS